MRYEYDAFIIIGRYDTLARIIMLDARLSVCLSVRLSSACFVTRRNNRVSTPYDRAMFLVYWKPNFVVLCLGVHPEQRVC